MKALVFIVIFISNAAFSFAQRGEILFSQGTMLYQRGKYQLASDSLEKALEFFRAAKDIVGEVKSSNMIGECKANLNQCEQALSILNYSMSLALANLKQDQPEMADTYYYLARATGGCARKFDIAIPLLRKSINMKRRLFGEGAAVADGYTFMGYLLTTMERIDSAMYFLEKALSIRKKISPTDENEIANILFYMAQVHERRGELSQALELHQKALAIRKAKLDSAHPNISNSLHQIGSVYQKFGNNNRALDYYQQGLDMRINSLGPTHANVAASYLAIGNLYGAMFNYYQAIHYIKQGNTTLQDIYGDKSDVVPTYDAYLAVLYGKVGDHTNAIAYLTKAQHSAEKNLAPHHAFRGIAYNLAGDYYLETGDFDKASGFFDKAIKIFKKAYGVNSVREADVLSKLASLHLKNKNPDKAIQFCKNAFVIYQAKMGTKNPKIASLYQLMGEIDASKKNYDGALLHYQKALGSLSSGFIDTVNLVVNPSLAQLESKPLALRITIAKAEALTLRAKKKPDQAALKQILNTHQFSLQLIDELASSYILDNAKAELEKESRKVYSSGIDVAYQLFALTQDPNYIKDAFAIAEKSKSAILLENIYDKKAKTIGGVPDSLIEKELDLQTELTFYQAAFHQTLNSNHDSATIAMHEKNIFLAKQRIEKLKYDLKKKFVAYFNLKYNLAGPSLEETQVMLSAKSSILVEFFMGDSSIYKITVAKNNLGFEKIKRDRNFNQLIQNYRKSLTDADYLINSRLEADKSYSSSAFALYNVLLKSSFEKNTDSNLIIVPDEELGQFNFGTLLTKPVAGDNVDYRSLEYLSKKTIISYAYSSAFFVTDISIHKSPAANSFAGFAPSYQANRPLNLDSATSSMARSAVNSGTLPLPGAADEVRLISKLMNGDSWLDAQASETNFKKYAGDYSILHLAMHSLLNNENPNYSELLFNNEKDDQNDGMLNINEIYNLKLKAGMVVLSACSSGFGKIQKGEGPISISRAFSYAGCPSVVMSLWKIPDDVTKTVMTYFYEELKKGREKDEALRLAQLKFLSNSNDPLYHHPYFWGSFVVMGDTNPLPGEYLKWIIYSGIVIASLLLAFLIYRKTRKAWPTQAH